MRFTFWLSDATGEIPVTLWNRRCKKGFCDFRTQRCTPHFLTLTKPRCEELYLLLCAVSTQQRLVHLSGYRLALWRCGLEAFLTTGFDTEQEE